ncbi:hypothetical protein Vadar_032955 [Vaccinium darrowii]|uniref:Uncharacterized protein n=1 Tax=Vaccinium darrowii TaxID=229202 RepID=A0ACB7YAL2_9ERIC|nr:hypothetical protein Vadar_032955 [Vaccinium darrowii]
MALSQFMDLGLADEGFKKQKSRVKWLALGDQNTRFFHQKLSTHNLRSKILSLVSTTGVRLEDPKEIQKEILSYYKGLLGSPFTHIVPATESKKELDYSNSTSGCSSREFWNLVERLFNHKEIGMPIMCDAIASRNTLSGGDDGAHHRVIAPVPNRGKVECTPVLSRGTKRLPPPRDTDSHDETRVSLDRLLNRKKTGTPIMCDALASRNTLSGGDDGAHRRVITLVPNRGKVECMPVLPRGTKRMPPPRDSHDETRDSLDEGFLKRKEKNGGYLRLMMRKEKKLCSLTSSFGLTEWGREWSLVEKLLNRKETGTPIMCDDVASRNTMSGGNDGAHRRVITPVPGREKVECMTVLPRGNERVPPPKDSHDETRDSHDETRVSLDEGFLNLGFS